MSLNSYRSILTSTTVLACALFAASEAHAATRVGLDSRCDDGASSCTMTDLPPPPAEPQVIDGGIYWNCHVNSSGFEICRPEFLIWVCDEELLHCFQIPAEPTCTSSSCELVDVPVDDRQPLIVHHKWECGLDDGEFASCDLVLKVCYDDGTCFRY